MPATKNGHVNFKERMRQINREGRMPMAKPNTKTRHFKNSILSEASVESKFKIVCVCRAMNKPNLTVECEKIMEELLKQGYKHRLSPQDLEKAIMQVRGIDQRTINRWVQVLFKLGYIQGLPYGYYQFNITMIPNLMSVLKNTPQTRIE